MRFIHTSDWHLGQTLHSAERGLEHQHFLDWLCNTLEQQQADALLIAGDVFDNANPSATSQKQFYRFLQQAKTRLPALDIVIIAGNHDSPGRLEAPGPLLDGMGVSVVGLVPRLADGSINLASMVVPLHQDGKVTAWCLAIPFLRPGDVPRVDNAADPYMAGIARLYQDVTQYALSLRQPGQAIIAMGHCHMVGGEISEDSERRIVIGGTEALSANMFDASICYAALGHLHLSQRVGRQEHLRYCGSPLPLSFAEVDYQHQVLCVDIDGEQLRQVTPLHVPRAVQLLRIPRQPAPLPAVLDALDSLDLSGLVTANQGPQYDPYLEVRVKLDAPEPGLRTRIDSYIAGKPLRLLKIDPHYPGKTGDEKGEPAAEQDTLDKLQPEDIFRRLYQGKYQQNAPADMLQAFNEVLHEGDAS
ncbi:exonuclease SbcCD subunit D C-terminal domain-containing protein [Undibacterium sp. TS12]|uniref:exonuclease SbcCD subunit D C-terminal domain-containing protein n=1 Tax=Undibacterium sp. TS12 TaxID=2908202 RepID=UPI001F4CB011|nr:exonuclease SbcCD subunit D C-terminal domain-containing protein [Undibacterium sp. TS12]MCH8619416.1 exonuclease SbcCD subunit D C-terminal domain-containing protein [Undibacterium sp. TS12]